MDYTYLHVILLQIIKHKKLKGHGELRLSSCLFSMIGINNSIMFIISSISIRISISISIIISSSSSSSSSSSISSSSSSSSSSGSIILSLLILLLLLLLLHSCCELSLRARRNAGV